MGTCERLLRVEASAEAVWDWMSKPSNLLAVNIFHAEVEAESDEFGAGDVFTIDHDFFGVYQQKRQAKIREVRPYFVSFGEYKAPDAPGRDPFPHNQTFQVIPVDDSSCIVSNKLTGRYVFPGAEYIGERLFRRYMPVILDDDNQVIAIGCGAMEPAKLYIPKGLLLWPAIAYGGRLVKKSTRRQVIEKVKAERAAAAAAAAAA
jgi:ligand-binding SRPBCC domain-containing protein